MVWCEPVSDVYLWMEFFPPRNTKGKRHRDRLKVSATSAKNLCDLCVKKIQFLAETQRENTRRTQRENKKKQYLKHFT
ncbi:MAG: hypothetical protein BGN96_04910 [Bacteroidales bacterium 45-6]|mgnify:CR=1 FL=1|nr:MAG: hypothetical protein BGN96_04910 [Bacteroidales bacterium 45-6]